MIGGYPTGELHGLQHNGLCIRICSENLLSHRATCNQSNDSICNLTAHQYIGVYGGLTLTVLLFSCARTLLLIILLLRSSRLLHNKMFATILRSPVLFYDTNPVGKTSTAVNV